MERGFLWIVLVIQFTMIRLASSSSSTVNIANSSTLSSSTPTPSQPKSTYSQSLPWSPSPSFKCTSWSVKQGGCSEACSNKGGTVTETCQCISNSVSISERSVCENYSINTTRTGECKKLCPTSASFNCKSWSVKQGGCSETSSNKGGIVTETCQCISNSVSISERSVCENYGIKTTRARKCKELCPASGTNASASFSWIVAVQCSLAMFMLFT